ncbi:MAG: DUF1028 domain-containing protein [Gemmataceae bacterium]
MSRLVLLIAFLAGGWVLIPGNQCPDGPYAATFSIVAYDPVTKEWGVGVASKFLAVGGVVPHGKAGVGAVATQAFVNYALGPKGVDLLAEGKTAAEALEELKKSDRLIEMRQLGLVDRQGDAVTFTGKKCMAYAGGKTGKHFACQGNILAGEKVVDAMARSYEEQAKMPLPWRIWSALDAADKAGGDKRGKQSAALFVVRERGGPNGVGDRYIDLRVDDSKEPVEELGRILGLRLPKPKVKPEKAPRKDS